MFVSASDLGSGRVTLPWLSRNGRQIVTESGEPVVLRGVGIGNWLLPEGYMWRFGDEAASPRQIEALVARLIGDDAAVAFWQRFREDYFNEDDVKAIAAYGYDSIRFAINSRVVLDEAGELREDGFALIERAVGWCRDHGLYAILDLHGAPGGQTGANIDDSEGWPDLFTDPRNEDLTEKIWVELATRYKDEPTVAMYDLLNEPVPGDHRAQYTAPLAALYKRLIAAIRAVDDRHLITLEGTNWSNDWTLFDELWDDRLVLQFHKYWNAPDTASIQHFLDERDRLDVPIFLGETGENNCRWFQGNFALAESHGIGWNFWPWKKLETENSPASIKRPAQWGLIQAAAQGQGDPDRETAQKIFDEYLRNIPYAACVHRDEVVNAMLRRAPVTLAPEHAARTQGKRRSGAAAGFREADALTVGFVDRTRSGEVDWANTGFGAPKPSEELEVRLEAGDWVEYEVELPRAGRIEVSVRGVGDSHLDVRVDGRPLQVLDASAGWASGRVDDLDAGTHTIHVGPRNGSVAIRAIEVRPGLAF
jgi:hypothetical protein